LRTSLFLDLRNPAPWRVPWADHYARILARVDQIEALGADGVWISEHHFFDDGYLPQPLTFAAAIAARTSRIRIGTAVLIAPLRPAIQIAEEAALVDLLSGGRLDLGLGAGYVVREFEAFGGDLGRRYSVTDERARALRVLLDEGGVTPPPIQRPLPIWMGYQGPQGAGRAGRLGNGLLSLSRDSHEPYRAGLLEGGHDPGLARMAGLMSFILSDAPGETRERLLPHIAYHMNSYREAAAGEGRKVEPITPERLRAGGGRSRMLPSVEVLGPEEAVERILRETRGLPAHEVFLPLSIAGMPEDLIDRHIELLLGEVRPALVSA